MVVGGDATILVNMKVSCVFNPDAAFSAFIRIGETMHSMSSSSEVLCSAIHEDVNKSTVDGRSYNFSV